MRFSHLPNELQLAVAKSCDPFTIEQLRFASRTLVALTRKIPRDLDAMESLSFEGVVVEEEVARTTQDASHDESKSRNVKVSRWAPKKDLVKLKEVYLNGNSKEEVHLTWDEEDKNHQHLYCRRFTKMTLVMKMNFKGMYVHDVFFAILFFESKFLHKFRYLRQLTLFDCDLRDVCTAITVMNQLSQLEIVEIVRCKISRKELGCMNCITNELILKVRNRFILDLTKAEENDYGYLKNFTSSNIQERLEIDSAKKDPIKAKQLIRKVNTCENINDDLLEKLKQTPIRWIELANINNNMTIGAIVNLIENNKPFRLVYGVNELSNFTTVYLEVSIQTKNELYWDFGNVKNIGSNTLSRLFTNVNLASKWKPIRRFEGTSLAEEIKQLEIRTADGRKTFVFGSSV